MAYEKQTWQTGDVITQEKLNHMEDGIEDAYELPAVTETDNGKVLGVENGAWSVVNGGGGTSSDVFVIHITKSNGEYSTDKTHQEILNALSEGRLCFATGNSTELYFPKGTQEGTQHGGAIRFSCCWLQSFVPDETDEGITEVGYKIHEDNTVTRVSEFIVTRAS